MNSKLLKRKTIFSKIFFVNMVTIFIGLIILTTLQHTLVSNYISNEAQVRLKVTARNIYNRLRMPSIGGYDTIREQLQFYIDGFAQSSDSHVIITDAEGLVILSSRKDEVEMQPDKLDTSLLGDIRRGEETIISGRLGGIFKDSMLTLGVPVIENGSVVGAIFVSSSIPELDRMNKEIMARSFLAFIFVIVITLILSYFLSRRMSRPIKKISSAARLYSKGDLQSRVDVDNDDEIGELADAFNHMADNLEKLEESRRNFVANVSHELRTPMTTISGFVDGILDGTIPQGVSKDYLFIVSDETKRLSKLVNSLLDITRMQAGVDYFEMTVFDINEKIRLTIINFEQRINEKNLDINVEFDADECMVYADSDSITRVLTNLFDNAVKFTPYGGRIEIKTRIEPTGALVAVRNSGDGIPQDELKNVFERFYKADKSRSLNPDGTGLGLFIVKSLINKHGKDIEVFSREGEYTEFSFHLPKFE